MCGRIDLPCPYCHVKFKWETTLKKHIYHKHFSAMQPPLSDKDSYIEGGIDIHLKRYLETEENKENNKSKCIKTTKGQILCQEEVSSHTLSSDHCQEQVYVENGCNGNKSTKEANQERAINQAIPSQVPGNALVEVGIHNKPVGNFEIFLKHGCENYLDVNKPPTTDSNKLRIDSPVADENAVNEPDSDQSSSTILSSDSETPLRYEDLILKSDSPYSSNASGSCDSLLDLLGARIVAELQQNPPEEDIIDLTDDK